MQRFTYTVLSRGTGLALRDALVTVLLAGTLELATLYSENSTSSEERLNPLTSDAFGEIWAYIPNGRYDLRVDYAGQPTRFIPDVQIFDAAEFDIAVGPLARITGGANQIAFFAGTNIAAITEFTQLARDIAEISDIDILRTFLGIQSIDLPLDVADGGTGSETAEDARTALDVYSKLEVDGIVAAGVTFPIEVSQGGTGETTASGARGALDVYSTGEVDALLVPAPVFAAVGTVSGSSYDLLNGDGGKYLRFTSGSAKTVTVRPNSTHALDDDSEWHIRNVGANNLTLSPGSGVTINAPADGTLVVAPGGTVTLKRVAADTFDLFGQVVPV